MPRFANLKGSMNPFDNNRPVLSSSDRTRDKKSTYIYAAAKKKFQTKRRCNSKNIKYYKKGTVRSVTNYKLQQNLARGNVLCEDCNNRGNLCGSINPSALTRVHMHNNNLSEFNGGGGVGISLTWAPPYVLNSSYQSLGFPVIQSDVSGVWGPASPPEVSKSDLSGVLPGSDPSLNMPFGYINNLIKIPRNLNGAGITIDPSNILFPADNCGVHSYFRNHSDIKKNIVLRGTIDLSFNITFATGIPFVAGDKCNDPSYNDLIGNFVSIITDVSFPLFDGLARVLYGRITNICCLNKFDSMPSNNKYDGMPWMDIYIEVYNIYPDGYDTLSYLVNTNPIRRPNWKTLGLFGGGQAGPFHWALSWGLVIYETTDTTAYSITVDGFIESVRIFQGTCKNNQTTGNKITQNYMSCLEDGTKKIKFT